MTKHPKLLYHFTCHLWWRFIKSEGIRFGEVPISRGRLLNFPNLTIDPDPANQEWAGFAGEILSQGDHRVINGVNKRAIRIAVKFPRPNPRLVRWVDLARQTGMGEHVLRRLNDSGGGHMHDWWIFRGTIPPARFHSVKFLDGDQVHPVEQKMIEALKEAFSSRQAIQMCGGA